MAAATMTSTKVNPIRSFMMQTIGILVEPQTAHPCCHFFTQSSRQAKDYRTALSAWFLNSFLSLGGMVTAQYG